MPSSGSYGKVTSEAGEIESWQIRGGETAGECEPLSGGETRIAGDRAEPQPIAFRIPGTVGEGDDLAVFAGGMVSRLIQDAQRRLGSAEMRLEMDRRDRDQAIRDLEELNAIAVTIEHLRQNQNSDEPPQ